jgi:hypothetical protein
MMYQNFKRRSEGRKLCWAFCGEGGGGEGKHIILEEELLNQVHLTVGAPVAGNLFPEWDKIGPSVADWKMSFVLQS